MGRVIKFFEDAGRLAIRLSGTISTKHGIGTMKKELLRESISSRNNGNADTVLNLMRNVKKVFDPYGIFNPNKIFD